MDVARMMAHITYLSEEGMERKFARARACAAIPMTLRSDYEVEHYLDHQAEIFLARFDPLTYLYMSRVMDYFDPFAESYARARTRASCSSPSARTGGSAPRTRSTSRRSCARAASACGARRSRRRGATTRS